MERPNPSLGIRHWLRGNLSNTKEQSALDTIEFVSVIHGVAHGSLVYVRLCEVGFLF